MAAAVAPAQLISIGRRERNVNINVGSFSETRKHSDRSRWICIYPAYLNAKKTIAEGRKIPMAKAVENPTLNEIRDVLVNAGFQIEIEPGKVYPRELNKYENLSRGRLRVHLKNDDGTPVKENFKDRESIFFYVAETIPKLKTRGSGASSSKTSQGASGSSSNTNEQSSKSNKKTGKKK